MNPAEAKPRMRREVGRKGFHVASVALPAFAWLAPRPVAMAVLGALAVVAVVVDFARLRYRAPRYWFLRTTRAWLRGHERRGFAGATYMAVAYALAYALFPRPIAVAAMLYNGLGDAAEGGDRLRPRLLAPHHLGRRHVGQRGGVVEVQTGHLAGPGLADDDLRALQRGEVEGVVAVTGQALNGNGRGPAQENRRFDNDFGKNFSPNGMIEYKGSAFNGALRNKLLIVRYSAGDDIMVIASLDMIAKGTLAKNTLVSTVMSNAGLEAAITAAGGRMIRTAVGDKNVIDEMLRNGFNFGGEQSGHLIFRDHGLHDRGPIVHGLPEGGPLLHQPDGGG